MPTAVFPNCPQPCGLPLRLIAVDAQGNQTYRCHEGHEVHHSAAYSRRYSFAVNNPGEVPENCSVCQKPIREKGPVAAANAKELGRMECSFCSTVYLCDKNTGGWVPAED